MTTESKTLKTATMKLSMTPLEKELLQGIAARAGVSVSELVRLVIVYQSIELPEPPSGPLGKVNRLDDRTECVRVTLAPHEKQALRERAQSLGCSMSDLVRRTAIAGKVVKQNDFDIEAVRKMTLELQKEGTNLNQIAYVMNRDGADGCELSDVKATMWRVRDTLRKADQLLDEMRNGFGKATAHGKES